MTTEDTSTEARRYCPNCGVDLDPPSKRPPWDYLSLFIFVPLFTFPLVCVLPIIYLGIDNRVHRPSFILVEFACVILVVGLICSVIATIPEIVDWLYDDHNYCYNCRQPIPQALQKPHSVLSTDYGKCCPRCRIRRNAPFFFRRKQTATLVYFFLTPLSLLPYLMVVPVDLAYKPLLFRYYPDILERVFWIAAGVLLSTAIGLLLPWAVAWVCNDGHYCYHCRYPWKTPLSKTAPPRSSGLMGVKHCPHCGASQWLAPFRKTFREPESRYLSLLRYLVLAFPLAPLALLHPDNWIGVIFFGWLILLGFVGVSMFICLWLFHSINTCRRCWVEFE